MMTNRMWIAALLFYVRVALWGDPVVRKASYKTVSQPQPAPKVRESAVPSK